MKRETTLFTNRGEEFHVAETASEIAKLITGEQRMKTQRILTALVIIISLATLVMVSNVSCAYLKKEASVVVEDAEYFEKKFVALYDEALEIITTSIKLGVVTEDGSITVTYPKEVIIRLKEIRVEAEDLYAELLEKVSEYDTYIDDLILLIRRLTGI